MMIKGYMGKMLEIDLEKRTHKVIPSNEEDLRLYVGGKGLGTKLLYDLTSPGIDPLGPDNPLIFTIGPLTATKVPQSNRFCVTAKSPLTGAIGTSTSGGNFAFGLKTNGYDALIIKNQAVDWIWIEIKDGEVKYHSAKDLLGKGTYETQELLPKSLYKAVIGQAGENKVLYAAIASQERIAGRTGIGAVMGSKKVKAICFHKGQATFDIDQEEKFKDYTKWFQDYRKRHTFLGDSFPKLGTASNLSVIQATGTLPTRNFQQGTFEYAHQISGQHLAAYDLTKQQGCLHCPVRCGRTVKVDGIERKGPEYETLALCGSNLCLPSTQMINKINFLMDDYGMDTISGGGVLGFAMELTEKGLLKSDLKFGQFEGLPEVIKDIAYRSGLGDDLANGVKRMADKYGGHDFANHVKGLELPGYDPRGTFAQGLSYLTTNRGGCHVQDASMYLETLGPLTIDPTSIKAKPALSIMMQNQADYLSSLVMCLFTSYGMIPNAVWNMNPNGVPMRIISKLVLMGGSTFMGFVVKHYPGGAPVMWWEKWMTFVTGEKTTMGTVQKSGARIFNLARLYNLREGFTKEDDTFTSRMLNEPIYKNQKSGFPREQLLPKYYKVRGWDPDGVPTQKTLDKLSIKI